MWRYVRLRLHSLHLHQPSADSDEKNIGPVRQVEFYCEGSTERLANPAVVPHGYCRARWGGACVLALGEVCPGGCPHVPYGSVATGCVSETSDFCTTPDLTNFQSDPEAEKTIAYAASTNGEYQSSDYYFFRNTRSNGKGAKVRDWCQITYDLGDGCVLDHLRLETGRHASEDRHPKLFTLYAGMVRPRPLPRSAPRAAACATSPSPVSLAPAPHAPACMRLTHRLERATRVAFPPPPPAQHVPS